MTPLRLLLVDDDPEMGVIVGLLARRTGQVVTRCPDVESAWTTLLAGEILQGHEETPVPPAEPGPVPTSPPLLILLDINLPGHSGLELLHRIRGQPRLARLPVAVFCQAQLAGGIAAAWDAGADYLVAKEVVTSPGAWANRIGEILAHLRGREGPGSVAWPQEGSDSFPPGWADAVNRALDQLSLNVLAAEVIAAVLRRGLARTFAQPPTGWLDGETGRLTVTNTSGTAREGPVEGPIRRLLSSLVDQLCCLYGPEVSQTFTKHLRVELARQP